LLFVSLTFTTTLTDSYSISTEVFQKKQYLNRKPNGKHSSSTKSQINYPLPHKNYAFLNRHFGAQFSVWSSNIGAWRRYQACLSLYTSNRDLIGPKSKAIEPTYHNEIQFSARARACVRLRISVHHNGIENPMNRPNRLASTHHSHAHQAQFDGVRRTCSMKTILTVIADYPADPANQTQQKHHRSQPSWALLRSTPKGRDLRACMRARTREEVAGDTPGEAVRTPSPPISVQLRPNSALRLAPPRWKSDPRPPRAKASVRSRIAAVTANTQIQGGADWRASSKSSRDACSGLARRRGCGRGGGASVDFGGVGGGRARHRGRLAGPRRRVNESVEGGALWVLHVLQVTRSRNFYFADSFEAACRRSKVYGFNNLELSLNRCIKIHANVISFLTSSSSFLTMTAWRGCPAEPPTRGWP
jgi:hypothetical protein